MRKIVLQMMTTLNGRVGQLNPRGAVTIARELPTVQVSTFQGRARADYG